MELVRELYTVFVQSTNFCQRESKLLREQVLHVNSTPYYNSFFVKSTNYWQRLKKGANVKTAPICAVIRYRGGGGGGRVTYFAEEGVACPRFCKRRVLFLYPGTKSPYNPRNIRGSDADRVTPEVTGLPSLLPQLLLYRQRIIKSKVKIRVPVPPMTVS